MAATGVETSEPRPATPTNDSADMAARDAETRAVTINLIHKKVGDRFVDEEIALRYKERMRGGYGFKVDEAALDGDLSSKLEGDSVLMNVVGGIWTEILPYGMLIIVLSFAAIALDEFVFGQVFLIKEVEDQFKEHFATVLNMSTLLVSFYMFGMMSRSIEIKGRLNEACTLQYGALAGLSRNRFINAKIFGEEQERFFRYRITNYAVIGFNCFLTESGGITHSRESYFRELVEKGKLTEDEFKYIEVESEGNFNALWTIFYQMAADCDAMYVAKGYRYVNNTEPNLTDVTMALVKTLYARNNVYPNQYVQMMVFFVGVVKVCTSFLGGYTCGLIWKTHSSRLLVIQSLISHLLILTFYASTSVVISHLKDPLSQDAGELDQQTYMTVLKTRLYRLIRSAEFNSYHKFMNEGIGATKTLDEALDMSTTAKHTPSSPVHATFTPEKANTSYGGI